MKKIMIFLAMAIAIPAIVNAADYKLENLTNEQLAAMVSIAVNANIHFLKDDTVSDNISEAKKDPNDKVKLGLIQFWMGKDVSISRVGKVNADGMLPVEFSFQYTEEYLSNGKVKTGFLPIEKQVVRISVKTDDFGDPSFLVDASQVIKSDAHRKIRDSVSLTLAQVNNLVSYLAASPMETGYARIKVGTVFTGTYYKDGNDLTITVTEVAKDGNNYAIKAKVEFLYQHKTPGSYTVKGVLDGASGKMKLEKDQAIELPNGFGMIGWVGPVNADDLSWSGTSVENVGIDFKTKVK